jgi:thioredoxin 1
LQLGTGCFLSFDHGGTGMKKYLVAIVICLSIFSIALAAKPTKEIKTLDQALKAKLPVVAKLGAEFCPPCRQMKPIIKELSKEQEGKIIFLDLDIYENKDLTKKYEVRLIPTILFFDKKGNLKKRTEGFMDKAALLKEIDSLKLNK